MTIRLELEAATGEELVTLVEDVAQRLRGATQELKPWTRQLARQFWAELRAPQTREALRVIAEAGGMHRRDLMQELHLEDPMRVKGVFAPVGALIKRLGVPRPYSVSAGGWYEVVPELAQAIEEELHGDR